jgi:hypothetical protein
VASEQFSAVSFQLSGSSLQLPTEGATADLPFIIPVTTYLEHFAQFSEVG